MKVVIVYRGWIHSVVIHSQVRADDADGSEISPLPLNPQESITNQAKQNNCKYCLSPSFPIHGKIIWCWMYAVLGAERENNIHRVRSSSSYYRIDSMSCRTSVKAWSNYLIQCTRETLALEEKRSRMYGTPLQNKETPSTTISYSTRPQWSENPAEELFSHPENQYNSLQLQCRDSDWIVHFRAVPFFFLMQHFKLQIMKYCGNQINMFVKK